MSGIPLQRSIASALTVAAAFLLGACASIRPGGGGNPTASLDRTVRLQLFLDARQFGPGVIDGRGGEFTNKALDLYRQAKGLPAASMPDMDGIQPFTRYTVVADDLTTLGRMGDSPAERAKQTRLPYTHLSELLSERFHTSQKFLRSLNPGVDLDSLPAGASVTVPNVGRPLRVDRFPSTYPPATTGNRRVIVDTRYRMLQVREGANLIAAFPITPGSSSHPALPGELRIVGAVPWPWYRHDEGVLDRGERTDDFHNLPPGPNSPVGILWAGLNRPGVGIHGSNTPDTIGRAGSHGCIRLSNWDAAVFYTLVRKNTPVTIL